MNLILSRRALNHIRHECLSHPWVETGGILAGRYDSDDIVVPLAIGAGPLATRTPGRFEPDVEWQQRLLDKYFDKYGLNYAGSFHRHPGGMRGPSSIDYRAAMNILSDTGWAVRQAVFPIILLNHQSIEIYPYYISRERPRFELIPLGVVPDSDPAVGPAREEQESICRESYYPIICLPWFRRGCQLTVSLCQYMDYPMVTKTCSNSGASSPRRIWKRWQRLMRIRKKHIS